MFGFFQHKDIYEDRLSFIMVLLTTTKTLLGLALVQEGKLISS